MKIFRRLAFLSFFLNFITANPVDAKDPPFSALGNLGSPSQPAETPPRESDFSLYNFQRRQSTPQSDTEEDPSPPHDHFVLLRENLPTCNQPFNEIRSQVQDIHFAVATPLFVTSPKESKKVRCIYCFDLIVEKKFPQHAKYHEDLNFKRSKVVPFLECEECPPIEASLYEIRNHLISRHSVLDLKENTELGEQCPLCLIFRSHKLSNLTRHMAIHPVDEYLCPYCDQSIIKNPKENKNSQKEFLNHVRKCSLKTSQPNLCALEQKVKLIDCPICHAKISRQNQSYHQDWHKKHPNSVFKIRFSLSRVPNKCKDCPPIENLYERRTHLLEKHPTAALRKYRFLCPICLSYQDPTGHRQIKHLLSHRKTIDSYICPYCSRSFSLGDREDQHNMRKHARLFLEHVFDSCPSYSEFLNKMKIPTMTEEEEFPYPKDLFYLDEQENNSDSHRSNDDRDSNDWDGDSSDDDYSGFPAEHSHGGGQRSPKGKVQRLNEILSQQPSLAPSPRLKQPITIQDSPTLSELYDPKPKERLESPFREKNPSRGASVKAEASKCSDDDPHSSGSKKICTEKHKSPQAAANLTKQTLPKGKKSTFNVHLHPNHLSHLLNFKEDSFTLASLYDALALSEAEKTAMPREQVGKFVKKRLDALQKKLPPGKLLSNGTMEVSMLQKAGVHGKLSQFTRTVAKYPSKLLPELVAEIKRIQNARIAKEKNQTMEIESETFEITDEKPHFDEEPILRATRNNLKNTAPIQIKVPTMPLVIERISQIQIDENHLQKLENLNDEYFTLASVRKLLGLDGLKDTRVINKFIQKRIDRSGIQRLPEERSATKSVLKYAKKDAPTLAAEIRRLQGGSKDPEFVGTATPEIESKNVRRSE